MPEEMPVAGIDEDFLFPVDEEGIGIIRALIAPDKGNAIIK